MVSSSSFNTHDPQCLFTALLQLWTCFSSGLWLNLFYGLKYQDSKTKRIIFSTIYFKLILPKVQFMDYSHQNHTDQCQMVDSLDSCQNNMSYSLKVEPRTQNFNKSHCFRPLDYNLICSIWQIYLNIIFFSQIISRISYPEKKPSEIMDETIISPEYI